MKTFDYIAEYLTAEEKTGLRQDVKKRLCKAFNSLPDVEVFKLAGIGGIIKKGWYQRANDSIRALFGDDAELFISLLASTSPRQTVEKNLDMTIEIYRAWIKAGRPLDEKSLDKLARLSDLKSRSLNVKRTFRGEPLSGYKVNSFRKNLSADYTAITIDTWMTIFADVTRRPGEKFFYLAYSARIRETAKAMNWQGAEVQETVWCYVYAKTSGVPVREVPEFSELLAGSEAVKNLFNRGVK